MTPQLPLTEAMIRQLASRESFQRGREYYQQGAVLSVEQRGDLILAEVEGSDVYPYQVHVTLAKDDIARTDCTCPYDWGGACKHIVAVLLTCLQNAEKVEERPTVTQVVAGLDSAQLHSLVVRLAQVRPELADLIESEALALRMPAGVRGGDVVSPAAEAVEAAPAAPAVPPPPDPERIRRQVRSVLRAARQRRRYEEYEYGSTYEIEEQLRPLLKQAAAFVEAGDGRSALAVLEALTDEAIGDLSEIADYSEEGLSVCDELGAVWTEAILSADLSPVERATRAKRLAGWQEEVGDYCETGFAAAEEAARQGWDYPPLQRVLGGKITKRGAWKGEAPGYADELAVARLNVLERQGRRQEYLYLAEAESQTDLYVTMLVKMGRIPEAVTYGLKYLGTKGEALAVAQALQAHGAHEEALQIAEHGMGLQGYETITLARWLRDAASSQGQTERALRAARALLREHPRLEDYQAIEKIAGADWPALREELLAEIRQRSQLSPEAQVEILLYEGRVEDAIALVDPNDYYTVVEPVVDAALESHPDWAIHACKVQAERIMNAGKSQHYVYAAEWLEKARTAYRNTGRKAEWEAYLRQVMELHRRKYTLVPLLERLL